MTAGEDAAAVVDEVGCGVVGLAGGESLARSKSSGAISANENKDFRKENQGQAEDRVAGRKNSDYGCVFRVGPGVLFHMIEHLTPPFL